jgi:predicted RNase H-like nuclease (RuvC/YqgF family)
VLGTSGCASLSDLENSKKQVEKLEGEKAELAKKLEEKDEEIDKLKSEPDSANRVAGKNEREVAEQLNRVRSLQGDVGTVSKCLKGVVELMNAASQENSGGVVVALTKLTEPCELAEKIIKRVEAEPTTDSTETKQNFNGTEVRN